MSIRHGIDGRSAPRRASGFRNDLRHRTALAHGRVDALFSGLSLEDRDGFADFAAIHHAAFGSILQSGLSFGSRAMLIDLRDRLGQDLAILGRAPVAPLALRLGVGPAAGGLAIDYMILGSRFGTNVLRGRWAASGDPRVAAAGHYFGARSDPTMWRLFCARLEEVEPGSPLARDVVAGTSRLFDLFLNTYDEAAASRGSRDVA